MSRGSRLWNSLDLEVVYVDKQKQKMETVKWDHEMVRPDEAHGYYVFTLVVVYLPWWSELGIKKFGLFVQVKFDLEGQGQFPVPPPPPKKKKEKKKHPKGS